MSNLPSSQSNEDNISFPDLSFFDVIVEFFISVVIVLVLPPTF